MFNHAIFNLKICIHNWKFDFIKNLASLFIYEVDTNLSSKRIHLKEKINFNQWFCKISTACLIYLYILYDLLLTYIVPNLWKQIVQIVSYLSLAQFLCWTVSDEMLFKIATCPYTFTYANKQISRLIWTKR